MKVCIINAFSRPRSVSRSKAIWPGSGAFKAVFRAGTRFACLSLEPHHADENLDAGAAIAHFKFGKQILEGSEMLDQRLP